MAMARGYAKCPGVSPSPPNVAVTEIGSPEGARREHEAKHTLPTATAAVIQVRAR